MRALLLTAFLMAITLPACAENAKTEAIAETSEQAAEIKTMKIHDYEIPVPVRIDQPIEWDAVKDYVPATLYEKPKKPMAAWEIYNEINQLTRDKMRDYDTALDELAAAQKDKYPGQSPEDIKFILADLFVTGDGQDISPEVQKLALESAALQYLHESFENILKEQGYRPSFHAPGPVPSFVPKYPQ